MKHLKLLLKTLINNNACVEAARTREKKYTIFAIIFAIFAVFFAVLPQNVNAMKVNGGDFLSGNVFGMDSGLVQFEKDSKDKLQLNIVTEGSKHIMKQSGWDTFSSEIKDQNGNNFTTLRNYVFKQKLTPEATEETKILEIYVYTDEDPNISYTDFVTSVAGNVNPFNKDQWFEWTKKDDGTKELNKARTTSCIIFGKEQVIGYVCQPTKGASATGGGDYESTKEGDLLTALRNADDNPSKTLESYRGFFNETYLKIRFSGAWRTTGIMVGVDFGIIFFMGLMVFILTRGKNNPFRIYSFWDGQKIAYYACLTPGILSLLGLLISNLAMMLFILGVGVRVMWLSMKTLRYQTAK